MFVIRLAFRFIYILSLRIPFYLSFFCIECDIGFYGLLLKCKKCPYPSFGEGCQSTCNCTKERCNHVAGCVLSEYDKGISYCDIHQARSSGRGHTSFS